MENTISKEKLEGYFTVTTKALGIVKGSIIKGREDEAREIISMAQNYVSDAKHFQGKEDYVNAFAALNYAHGWIDSGVRLNIFDVDDDTLFTVK